MKNDIENYHGKIKWVVEFHFVTIIVIIHLNLIISILLRFLELGTISILEFDNNIIRPATSSYLKDLFKDLLFKLDNEDAL